MESRISKPKFTQQQIAYTHKQAEGGTAVAEVCRKVGITEQSFYRWKRKFDGMGVAELLRLKQLEEENKKLKSLVADLLIYGTIITVTDRRRSSHQLTVHGSQNKGHLHCRV